MGTYHRGAFRCYFLVRVTVAVLLCVSRSTVNHASYSFPLRLCCTAMDVSEFARTTGELRNFVDEAEIRSAIAPAHVRMKSGRRILASWISWPYFFSSALKNSNGQHHYPTCSDRRLPTSSPPFCPVLAMSAFDCSCPTSFLNSNNETLERNDSHGVGDDASARWADEYLDTVESGVQQVLQFAETTARLLADTVGHGHDAEYYLRLIFTRGAYLHPLPPAAPHFFSVAAVSCEWDNVYPTRNAAPCPNPFGNSVTAEARLRREFKEEFNRLTGERKQNLLDVLMTQGEPALEGLTIRSPPSTRAQDLHRIFEVIKGLVRLLLIVFIIFC